MISQMSEYQQRESIGNVMQYNHVSSREYQGSYPSIRESMSVRPKYRAIARNQNMITTKERNTDALNEQVIIIEPISTSEEIETKKFFANEVRLARDVNNSPLGKYQIIDTYKNYAKKLLVVKIPRVSKEELAEILKINVMGEWNVKCRLPVIEQVSRGVFGPISPETPDEDILEAIKQNANCIKEYAKAKIKYQRKRNDCSRRQYTARACVYLSGKIQSKNVCWKALAML